MTKDGKEILRQLKASTNLERAKVEVNYHKSSREHWGVASKDIERIIKTFQKEWSEDKLLSLSKELWNSNLFDAMITSAKLLNCKNVSGSQKVWNWLTTILKNDVPIMTKYIIRPHPKQYEEVYRKLKKLMQFNRNIMI